MTDITKPWNVTPETQVLVEEAFGKGAEMKVFLSGKGWRCGIKLGRKWVCGTETLTADDSPDAAARRSAEFALKAKK